MLGMRSVGAQDLGEALPEYLRRVESGESFRVVDRRRVVAELRPVPAPVATKADDVESRLRVLAEGGQVTRASLSKKGWAWRPKGAGLPEGTARALIDELRDER
jgi:antitoxin (DNA-binding transcriptional repressor) of toxin-antitoxin stability system